MPARRVLPACTVALAAVLAAPPAAAVTCYVVMDRNDNVIYRDIMPPVDMSDAGKSAREAMRQRGEFFLFHEAEICPSVEFFTGAAGTVALSLDQTLAPSALPKPAAVLPPPAQPARRR
jgi:hypothetical protein